MNLAETADLVVNLKLNNQTGPGIKAAETGISHMGASFKKLGDTAATGAKTAMTNIAKIGIVGAGLIGAAVVSGIGELAQLEDATTAVDGAIKQLGLTGKVTSTQVAAWAGEIETNVQAAFDDKAITNATATLIRFGHVTADNIKPAMVVMTDLATKTGDVDSAATLLAKALDDPTNAAGKLAKAGLILTQAQKDQIDAMTKAGDIAGAQTVLLDALSTATAGAAAASKGPYNDAINTLKDTFEDVRRALAIGFLPVIQKVADLLKGKLADKGFLDQVTKFGQDLAGYLQKALDAAQNIPWDTIKDAMKLAGAGAKAAFDLFTGLPPWVQEAVITGWGLNKLTGGALSSIVTQLGTGLIKGVLGMTAGVVNITAGTVNGPGGGIPGAAGGGLGGAAAAAGGVATLAGAAVLAADQIGRLPTLLQGFQEAQSASNVKDIQTAFKDLMAGSTMATAFKPLIDKVIGMFPGGAAQLVPGGRVNAELQQPSTGRYPVRDPNPTTIVPGPGFTEYMHTQAQQTAQGTDELARIHQQATNQLGVMTGVADGISKIPGAIDDAKAAQVAQFVATWGSAHADLVALGVPLKEMRKDIAEKLGITVSELKTLRGSFRSSLADELGITTGELRRLRQSTHYDEQKMADSLGITVDQLRTLKDEARTTAANTTALKNKDFSTTVKVTTNFNVSARTVAQATTLYRTQAGRLGVGVS